MLLTMSLVGIVPTGGAASAERVGTLDLPPLSDGSANGLVGASAVHHDGKTYVFGGRLADGSYSSAVYSWDHASGEVRQVATMPTGRQSGAAVYLGGHIYYFGGAMLVEQDLNGDGAKETVPQATSEILVFNVVTGELTRSTARLPAGAWGLAASASGSKAYVFGGFSFDVSNPAEIQRRDWILRFDPASTTKIATLNARLPYAVQDAGIASIGNRIYLFGGLSNNDNTTNPCPMSRYYNADTNSYEDRRLSVCTTDGIIMFDPSPEITLPYEGKLPQRTQFLNAAASGGKAYIPGGRLPDGAAGAGIVEFSPSANPPLRTLVPTLPRGIYGAPVVADPHGALFVFGGRLGNISELTGDIVKILPGATPPFPPRGLAATQMGGGVRLEWQPPAYDGDAPVSSYRVYRAEPGQNEARLADVSDLSYEDRTARPGAQYVYRVTAVNRAGESAAASTSRETDATVPGAVRDLRVYGGNAEVVVRWAAPADNGGSSITGYRVYRDGGLHRSLPPSVLEMRDADLENGRTYSYTVRAVNVKGEGAAAPARTASPAAVPESPTNLQVTVEGETVRLQWLAPATSADRFIIYKGDLPGNVAPVANTSGTDHVDRNVQRGRTYHYAVAAANGVGESPPSQVVSISLVRKPGAPEKLFAAPLEGAIRLTWQAPADTGEARADALRYYVSRLDPGASAYRILDTGGDLATTAFVDTKVLPGVEYAYKVTTLNPLASDDSAPARAAAKAPANQRPVAFLQADVAEADVGEQVVFDAAKSSDPDGSIAYYLFDFGDGSAVENTTTPRAPHAFKSAMFVTVTLRVVDDAGETSDPVSLTLKVGEPKETQDGSGGTTPPTRSGETPAADVRPGNDTPGPGLALVALAALGAALVARRRDR